MPFKADAASAADHEGFGDVGDVGRQVVGERVGQALLSRIVAHIDERQHDNRQFWGAREFVIARGVQWTRRPAAPAAN